MPELPQILRRVVPALAGIVLTGGILAAPATVLADEPHPSGGRGEPGHGGPDHEGPGQGGYGYGRYDLFTDPYRYDPSDQARYPATGGVYLGQTYEEADTGIYLADFFPAN